MPPRRVATPAERGDSLVFLDGKACLCSSSVSCDFSTTIIGRKLRTTCAILYLHNLLRFESNCFASLG